LVRMSRDFGDVDLRTSRRRGSRIWRGQGLRTLGGSAGYS
jgi:hypothetical protein